MKFQNFILRIGSQAPGEIPTRMIQVMAIGVMYRLAMMLLKKNEVKIFEQIDANPSHIDTDVQELHRKKIRKLLAFYYPTVDGKRNINTPKEAWGQFERWLGHDLLVKAIVRKGTVASVPVQYASDEFMPPIIMEEWNASALPQPNKRYLDPDDEDSESNSSDGGDDKPKPGKDVRKRKVGRPKKKPDTTTAAKNPRAKRTKKGTQPNEDNSEKSKYHEKHVIHSQNILLTVMMN